VAVRIAASRRSRLRSGAGQVDGVSAAPMAFSAFVITAYLNTISDPYFADLNTHTPTS
jgi:hypothetical protein